MANRIDIVDASEAGAADCLVCLRLTSPLKMPDNLVASCERCGAQIQHRPHAPPKPEKVCLQCAAPLLTRQITAVGLEGVVTLASALEYADWLRRKGAN